MSDPKSGVFPAVAARQGTADLLVQALQLADTLRQALDHEPRALLVLAALHLLTHQIELGARARMSTEERAVFFRELEAVRRLCQRISVAPGR